MAQSGSPGGDFDEWLEQLRQTTGSEPSSEGREVRVSAEGQSGIVIPTTPEGMSLVVGDAGSAGSFGISTRGRPPRRLTIQAAKSLTTL
jgi:hypothetical protein